MGGRSTPITVRNAHLFHDSLNEYLIEDYAGGHFWHLSVVEMSPFSHLIRFECAEDGSSFFADLGGQADGPPSPGTKMNAFASMDDLANKNGAKNVTIRRVCLPLRLAWRSL